MVEKERQRGRTAYVPETSTPVLKETTLAELGVDTSFDNLNLAPDRFTLGVKKVGEETVYVGLLNHGLAGGHFAQFLNNVSPFADQDLRGIIDDINLPILAEHDYREGKDKTTSEFIRLHERHRDDPRVGPTYIRFAEDHADSWLMALEFGNGWEVFDIAQRTKFINSREDKEEVRRQLFSEDGNILEDINDPDARSRLMLTIKRYDIVGFKEFCKDKGLKEDDYYSFKPFLETLSEKTDQEKFAFVYFTSLYRQIFVFLDSHRVISDENDPTNRIRQDMKFADNSRDVVISDGKGTKAVLTPTGQSSDRFSWKAIEYQFPEGYEESSRYPVIAWKKDGNGTRTFLTQQEAMPLVKEFGLEKGEQGDTKLGEITVASFARHIIKDWEPKMTLKPLEGDKRRFRRDDFEQPMRGAQMPAWVGIERHKEQLLKSETSVLAVLER